MELLDVDLAAAAGATTLLLSLDGWTDAGRGGSLAVDALRGQWDGQVIGAFDVDRLYDYRDRRPLLEIDRGIIGSSTWPEFEVVHLQPPDHSPVLLLTGWEPDFRWRTICDDIGSLTGDIGITRYVGLGAVPGPVPHTRPTRVITTASDPSLFEQFGRPHEQVVVPASLQVIIEKSLADAGLTTLGLWARVPHYVAGEYPAAAAALLSRLSSYLHVDVDPGELLDESEEHRERLDEAASGSPEVQDHIRALEEAYDEDLSESTFQGPLPTGDQIAAELERFLRNRSDG
jgi:hypothetical protein